MKSSLDPKPAARGSALPSSNVTTGAAEVFELVACDALSSLDELEDLVHDGTGFVVQRPGDYDVMGSIAVSDASGQLTGVALHLLIGLGSPAPTPAGLAASVTIGGSKLAIAAVRRTLTLAVGTTVRLEAASMGASAATILPDENLTILQVRQVPRVT